MPTVAVWVAVPVASVTEVDEPTLPVLPTIDQPKHDGAPQASGIAVQFTVNPGTGLLYASRTTTAKGLESVVPATADKLSAEALVIVAGGPATTVNVNMTGEPVRPATVAVLVVDPATVELILVVAMPFAPVREVDWLSAPAPKVTAQFTNMPGTALPAPSVTKTAIEFDDPATTV